MPEALFFNIPADGHINPSLPLVVELIWRGHEITYLTTEMYRQRVEATDGLGEAVKAVREFLV
jgi:UDP:flavonoid glycosyltransferase YjiC (YdhE family)